MNAKQIMDFADEHAYEPNMFNSKSGQEYMQMLVDNHIIRVQSDWTLYNQMIGDNCGGKRWK